MTDRAPFPEIRLKPLTNREAARIRVYGVPPSGTGSEFFLPWVAGLPEQFELVAAELPGRGARSAEPSITDVGWAAASIADAIAADLRRRPLADGFYALFGHSFGALLAFEAAHCLRSALRTEPGLLALSAVAPPHCGGLGDYIARGLASGVSAITGLMGWEQPTDATVARAVFTPFLADAVAQLQHVPRPQPPLGARLSVFGGLGDPVVDPDTLDEWSAHTTAGVRVHRYPGDHQYLRHRLADVVADLTEDLLAAYR